MGAVEVRTHTGGVFPDGIPPFMAFDCTSLPKVQGPVRDMAIGAEAAGRHPGSMMPRA